MTSESDPERRVQQPLRRVNVVPHTHWDREWYAPFPVFRQKLTDLLDELIPRLEAGDAAEHFVLDGQLAVIDDYLELRPEMQDRIAALGRSGRLGIGPWYVLMDEFLVSGETIVRDLQLGLRRAGDFGGAMPVGYLPDMFGHIAQMPQLLRLADLEHAVVWRGTPRAITGTGFWWYAPDGSRVRAEYLPQGYGNGAHLPDDAGFLVGRVREFLDAHGSSVGDGDILWMNGTDHQLPAPWLGRVIREANSTQHQFEFVVTSLAEHLARAPVEDLDEWRGELRSGARANLLMGVASNRVDVKQAAAAAERWLERIAEPMCALFTDADEWPGAAFDLAWRDVIRNAAHDSVCACSHDDVVAAVLHRYADARHTAEVLTERALYFFGCEQADAGTLVVNTTDHHRIAVVAYDLAGDQVPDGLQVIARVPAIETVHHIPNAAAAIVVERELELRSEVERVDVARDEKTGNVVVHLHATGARGARHLHGDAVARVRAATAPSPDGTCEVRVVQEPRTRILHAIEVPPFGWRIAQSAPHRIGPPVSVDNTTHDVRATNGLVDVVIDARDGTFAIGGTAGFGRLVDMGDAGDTYNYSPPRHDVLVERPESVVIDLLEHGPVRARVAIAASYSLPARVVDDARVGRIDGTVVTTVELRTGEPFVRVDVVVDNVWRDHRLRAHLPLPEPALTSYAECAFAVVERGLRAEGGPGERALPTFPSRRFVRAGGLTVVHDGLLEYELVDIDAHGRASTLALTLLRCTGMLSRGPMRSRPLPAGPELPLEGPQLRGPQHLRFALHLGDSDPYTLADAFTPFPTVAAPGGGDLPPTGTIISVTGAEVSAVHRVHGHPDQLVVRVHNPRPHPTVLRIDGYEGEVTDLRGAHVRTFDGELALAAWQIVTIRGALTSSRRHPRHPHHR